ncbi:FHA domain-containing protein [Halobacteriovorax sp. GB3]|uniref:FHA domain-containing protein n=1 Tax=Halobacteriovorax sp. GB3 TaxID=2719615 RepID=UPI002362DE4A|nr:FHA domain-containing protein [Halobacteriovorax sp. GB3]MDD0854449.1 FHA domain-containing protein [Halobacteriovorax sp. GB3]
MKLSVSKLNKFIEEIDLAKEIEGIEQGEITFLLGRSSDCHVCLNDQTVSREHAQISYIQGNWSIRKLPGFGVLYINGVPSEGAPLSSGDIIKVGEFNISVYIEPVKEQTPTLFEGPNDDVEEIEVESDEVDDVEDLTTELDAPIENNEQEVESEDEVKEFDISDGAEESEFPEDNDGTEGFDFDSENSEFENTDEQYSDQEEGYDEYGDDEYAVDSYDDDMGDKTNVAISFAKVSLELFGEYAPYDNYSVRDNEIFIGRDPEKCQIVLNDSEVSSIHAVIKRNNITCELEDLQSSNGTLLNGKRVNKDILTNGDEFIIGSTTFTVHIGSDFLEAEKQSLMPVEENQVIEVEEVVEVDEENFDDDDIEGASFGEAQSANNSLFSKEALKDPAKRKKLIYIVLGLVAAWVLLDEGGDSAPEKKAPKKTEKVVKKKAPTKSDIKLTPEQAETAEGLYQLAQQLINEGRYREAVENLDQLFLIAKEYKNAKQIYELAKQGLARLKELQEKEEREKREAVRKKKVKDLVEKAKAAVEEKNTVLAENLFTEIIKLDPENYDVTELKLEIEAYKRKIQEEDLAKAQAEAERNRQESELQPGKNFYLKKEWYNAVLKLEDFLRLEGMDDDLITEASKMLEESRENLKRVVNPLLGKARSLKEGQDLKGAYETYNEILQYDPSSIEALNEMDKIRSTLHKRSRKTYREAIISESLSQFNEAKEKYQEVQQISPTDSEYYKKATEKLKNYLD